MTSVLYIWAICLRMICMSGMPSSPLPFAGGGGQRGYIVGGAQELPVVCEGPIFYFLIYWDVFHLFVVEGLVVVRGVWVG